jgi:hypothetical protein
MDPVHLPLSLLPRLQLLPQEGLHLRHQHIGVVYYAQVFLYLLDAEDRFCEVGSVEWREELHRVPHPLGCDPHLVKLVDPVRIVRVPLPRQELRHSNRKDERSVLLVGSIGVYPQNRQGSCHNYPEPPATVSGPFPKGSSGSDPAGTNTGRDRSTISSNAWSRSRFSSRLRARRTSS